MLYGSAACKPRNIDLLNEVKLCIAAHCNALIVAGLSALSHFTRVTRVKNVLHLTSAEIRLKMTSTIGSDHLP